jgi:hypothetical protein
MHKYSPNSVTAESNTGKVAFAHPNTTAPNENITCSLFSQDYLFEFIHHIIIKIHLFLDD